MTVDHSSGQLRETLQEVVEDVIGNGGAAVDALVPVETPMDPQVDAALGIFERRLAEAVIRACHDRPHLVVCSPGAAVELVRDKCKADVVPAVESLQNFEHRGTEGSMPGNIGGE